jgi:tetratricopeptide (TPR) repeat protein
MNADQINAQDFNGLVAAAQDALSSGDWAAAAAFYEELVRADPAQVDLKYKLAQAYEELGRLQDAIDLLSDPPVARLNKSKRRLAKFYIAAGNFKAATPLVDELLAKSPDSSKFAAWKAICEGRSADDPRVARRIEQAQELASADRLEEAEQAYLQLINDYPAVARSYLHLGQIYAEQRRWPESIATLSAGLALEPRNKKLTFSLARSLSKNGQPAEAVDLLKSEELQTEADAQFLLQRCYMELSEWGRVEEVAEHLLAILPPDDPFRDSVLRLRQDAAVKRDSARIDAIAESGDSTAAIAGYRDLAERYATSPIAWLKLGVALTEADQDDEAGTALREALRLDPEDMDIRRALSRLVIKTGEEPDILRYVSDAIAADVADYECLRWLARYHADRNDWPASLDSAQRAMAMDPQHASARVLAVRALIALGRFPEALDELEILVSTGAKRVETLQLKADIFVKQGRVGDAIQLYREALEESPKHPRISHRLSCALLLNGDIEGFHRFHEKRRDRASFIENERERPFELWNGQLSIKGKLLVWTEATFSLPQNILCVAFIEPLARLGFDIVLEVDPRLLGLCRRSFPDVTVVGQGDELPGEISHHTPAGSLSRWFKHDLDSFSSMRPFFVTDAEAVATHRERLKQGAGEAQLLVGVTMPSDPGPADKDTVRLDQLLDAIAAPGITFVGLEPGQSAPSRAGEGKHLIDIGLADSDDLDALSAVVAAMDLVIGTDSVAAHIAGAVGTPSFLLLPAVPAPYWLARGDRSIWYPATRLFRRSSIDADWGSVLGTVANAVRDFAGGCDTGRWLADSSMQSAQSLSDRSAELRAREIADAIPAFITQGPFAPSAYRSALELIERLPAECRSSEVQRQRAELLARFGYWEQALDAYAALATDNENDPLIEKAILSVSLAMYDLEHALGVARELAKDAPTYHVTAANILYRARRYDEAIAELREASLQEQQLRGLGTLFGTILLERNELARAEAYLSDYAAMTRRPEDYTLLGQSLSGQGRQGEALAVFDKALMLAPNDPAANFWRTQARLKLGLAPQVPLAPLLGDRPDVTPDDVVVFFAADSGFFWEHGLILLASVGQQSPDAKCHVHVINPDAGVARAIEVARTMLPQLGLSFSFEHVDFDRCADAHVRTYYASVRFVRLAEIFASAPASYLCLDADCIVRGDIATAFAGEAADVRMLLRYDERPHVTVAAGALALSPTAGAAKFIDQVSALIRPVLEAGEAAWFLDQIVLGHVHRNLADGEVQVSLLERIYLDWFFQDESLIWTGKGPRKFEDEKYKSELARYRYLQETEQIAQLMAASTKDAQDR